MDANFAGFVALAVLILGLFAWLRQDIRALRGEMDKLRDGMSELRDRVARIEGLLEGVFHAAATWRPSRRPAPRRARSRRPGRAAPIARLPRPPPSPCPSPARGRGDPRGAAALALARRDP